MSFSLKVIAEMHGTTSLGKAIIFSVDIRFCSTQTIQYHVCFFISSYSFHFSFIHYCSDTSEHRKEYERRGGGGGGLRLDLLTHI